MPALEGAALGGALVAGASLAGAGMNSIAQGKMNKRTERFNWNMWNAQNMQNQINWMQQNAYNEAMWEKQNTYDEQMWTRQNEYNEKLWHMQNEYNQKLWNQQNAYNSPAAQMERYKEAGLNPYLIYGQSNMGGTVSTANLDAAPRQRRPADKSAGLDTGRPPGWNPRAPVFDFHSGLMSMASFREQAARTNNLEKQNDVLEQEVIYRAAQTANLATSTAKTKFELDLARELRQVSVDAAKESLRKLQIESDVMLSRNEREIAKNAIDIRHAVQSIANMRGQLINMEVDNRLKELDYNLKRLGIQPTDNKFMRALGQFLADPENNLNKIDSVGEMLRKRYIKWKY